MNNLLYLYFTCLCYQAFSAPATNTFYNAVIEKCPSAEVFKDLPLFTRTCRDWNTIKQVAKLADNAVEIRCLLFFETFTEYCSKNKLKNTTMADAVLEQYQLEDVCSYVKTTSNKNLSLIFSTEDNCKKICSDEMVPVNSICRSSFYFAHESSADLDKISQTEYSDSQSPLSEQSNKPAAMQLSGTGVNTIKSKTASGVAEYESIPTNKKSEVAVPGTQKNNLESEGVLAKSSAQHNSFASGNNEAHSGNDGAQSDSLVPAPSQQNVSAPSGNDGAQPNRLIPAPPPQNVLAPPASGKADAARPSIPDKSLHVKVPAKASPIDISVNDKDSHVKAPDKASSVDILMSVFGPGSVSSGGAPAVLESEAAAQGEAGSNNVQNPDPVEQTKTKSGRENDGIKKVDVPLAENPKLKTTVAAIGQDKDNNLEKIDTELKKNDEVLDPALGTGDEQEQEMGEDPEAQEDGSLQVNVEKLPNEKYSKPLQPDESEPVNYNTEMDGDSYFFTYFMLLCIIFIVGYVFYHNKQKILALFLEGRKGKRQNRGRRPNSANYHKLDSNLEEAITSSCKKNTTNVIY